MKILHISNYYYPHIGGIEQTARDIVNSLKDKHEQQVICFNHDKGTNTDIIDDIEVTRVNCQVKVASQSIALSYGKVLKKVINNFNPDFVIFHYPNPFIGHFLQKYLKHKKFKFIIWWHLDITKQKLLRVLFKGQNKKLLKYADKVVSTSPNYIEGSPWLQSVKDKCVVIPSCINEERLKYDDSHLKKAEEIKRQCTGKTICFAFGRHVEYKGLTYLIKVSKILPNNFKLFIGGTGPLTEQLKYEAKDDSKIEFLGRISDDELKSYLLACDIFCFPSITKNEAFGLGLVEAMYYGKPAVTFTIEGSGVNYVNLNQVTGLEVKNCDIEQYRDAILFLSEDTVAYNNYSRAANQRVNDLFLFLTFKDCCTKLMEDFHEKNSN